MALFINLTNKLVYVDHQEDPKGFMRLYMQKTYGDIGLWIILVFVFSESLFMQVLLIFI